MSAYEPPEHLESHGTPEARISALGLELPPAMVTTGYFELTRSGSDMVFVSGHVPWKNGEFVHRGKVGRELGVTEAQEVAAEVALACISSIKGAVGELSRVRRILNMVGLINCTPEFDEQSKVMNSASKLLLDVFGDRGRHSRSAIGVASLPHGVAVEIEMVVQTDSEMAVA